MRGAIYRKPTRHLRMIEMNQVSDSMKKKSPRAPSISLGKAMELVSKIYERERLHSTPVDVAAQALGYKNANNGAALSVIASLRYFGLIERPKDGFVAVNRNFETYKFAPDDGLKRSIVTEYLKTPSLYAELLEKYASGLPSEANLRFELIQKGFTPQTSELALRVFLGSVEFANFFDTPLSEPSTDSEAIIEPEDFAPQLQSNSSQHEAKHHAVVSEPKISRVTKSAEFDEIPVRLPRGRKAWLIIPAPFYEADKARIKAQIDLLLAEDEN